MKIYLMILLFLLPNVLSAQVNSEILRKEKLKKNWINRFSIDIDLKDGNERLTKFVGGYRLDFIVGEFYSFFDGNIEYKVSNDELTSNNGTAHFRTTYDFTQLIAIEAFMQKEYDEFILLKDRNLVGSGLRINILDINFDSTSNFEMHLGIGAMFEHENYDTPDNLINNLIKSTNYLSFKLQMTDDVLFNAVTYFQFQPDKIKNHRSYNYITLTFKINDYLSFSTSVAHRYYRIPMPEVKHYDIEFLNGIILVL